MYNLLTKVFLTVRLHWRDLYISFRRSALNRILSSLTRDYQYAESSKNILVEALWENPVQYLRIQIALNALRQTAKLHITGLVDKEKIFFKRRTLEALGAKTLIKVRFDQRPKLQKVAEDFVDELNSCEDLLQKDIFGGYPGHYLYDAILKQEGVGSLASYHPQQIKRYVLNWLCYVKFYEELFDQNRFDEVILSHLVTIRFSSLAWVALKRNVSVTLLNYRNSHITAVNITDPSSLGEFNEDILDYKSFLSHTEEGRQFAIDEGRLLAREIISGRTGEISLFKGEESPFSQTQNALMSAAGGRPIISVFASCWSDFPNLRGTCWFNNFEDFINRIANYALNQPGYFFVFRAHPAEAKYGRRTSLKRIMANFLVCDNIAMCPEGMSAEALIDMSDLLISPQGSIAYEQTARGKNVLIGRSTDFTDWNICNYASDECEFFEIVDRLDKLQKPSKMQIDHSLAYLALWQGSPWQGKRYCLFPWGRYGNQLWLSLPEFIRQNEDAINNEVRSLKNWFESDRRYGFNTTKWIQYMKKGEDASVD